MPIFRTFGQSKTRFAPAAVLLALALYSPISAAPTADFAKEIEPILADYCYDCHADGADKGDFSLDFETLDSHLKNHDLWLTVWKNARSQIMPPSEKKQPSHEQLAKLLAWIESDIFKLDLENPDPGRVTARRLNRLEYKNSIQDIFGHYLDANEAFPPDDTGYGFDNIGDVLSISPLLMEKYLETARGIVAKVVRTGPENPTYWFNGDQFVSEKKNKSNWVPFDNPETFVKIHRTEHPGEYQLYLDYRINEAQHDTDNTAKLLVRINGKQVADKFLAWGDTETLKLETKVPIADGENRIELELVTVSPPKDGQKKLALQVQNLRLVGPLDGSHMVYPSEYNKIFIDGPPEGDAAARDAYLRKLIAHWGLLIWRRPVEKRDEDRLVALAGLNGDDFEEGFAQILTAMLVSPKFLFRAEIQPEPNNAAKIVPIDEFALASRLSYFLWQSCPDNELLELAAKGELRKNLRAEVDRMVKDKRSQRFVDSFVGQWLQARDITSSQVDAQRVLDTRDDKKAQSLFSYRTKEAMRDETEMMFAHVLQEDHSVLDFLTANYTFLNEDLARTYGIDGVKGREMRKVDLPENSPRGGILGQGTFLVITSNPTRTSPVKRGLFVLENLLAAPAPPAPGEVPTVEEQRRKKENQDLTMRELMRIHAEDKVCASCHARFDPIGFALENYNAIGMWRTEEGGKKIDAGGKLITGESFADAKQLSKVIATQRRPDFYRCLTEKLLTYATGRGIEYYDAPSVDKITAQLEAEGGKMSALIYGIVESAPFQKRRGDK